MKKFKYRLEAILKVKEHIEKEKQKDVAAASDKVNRQKRALDGVRHRSAETLAGKRSSQGKGTLSLAELLVFSRYLTKLKGEDLTGRELLKGLQKNEQEKRNSLQKAVKERKIHSKLKERQQDAYHKDVNSQLTKESDEVGITIHRRKGG